MYIIMKRCLEVFIT